MTKEGITQVNRSIYSIYRYVLAHNDLQNVLEKDSRADFYLIDCPVSLKYFSRTINDISLSRFLSKN